MILAAGVVIVALVCFAALGPALARRLTPELATLTLVFGSVVTVGSTLVVLVVLASTWLGELAWVKTVVPWSVARLTAANPVPTGVSQVSLALVLLSLIGVAAGVVRYGGGVAGVIIRAHGQAPAAEAEWRTGRRRSARRVVLVDDAAPDAFSTPHPGGRIVLTTGLVSALSPQQREIVLLHEEAHLCYQHGWLRLVVRLAASAVPFLRPTATAIDGVIERWADEYAARRIGDRRAVATTIAQVGLLRPASPPTSRSAMSAHAAGGDITTRVRSMLAPAPAAQRPIAVASAAILLAAVVCAGSVAGSGEDLFESAAIPITARTHLERVQGPTLPGHGSPQLQPRGAR